MDMEHEERIFELMMTALDEELDAVGYEELGAELALRPELAEEWAMMQQIDLLFHETPMVMPETDFAQRTLARLPNRSARLWGLSISLGIAFLVGLLPLAGIYLLGGVDLTLFQPELLGVAGRSIFAVADTLGIALRGIWQLLNALGEFAVGQPLAWGGLLVMAGMILLWGGVYSLFMRQPRLSPLIIRS